MFRVFVETFHVWIEIFRIQIEMFHILIELFRIRIEIFHVLIEIFCIYIEIFYFLVEIGVNSPLVELTLTHKFVFEKLSTFFVIIASSPDKNCG